MARKKARDLSKTISKAVEHNEEVVTNVFTEKVVAPIAVREKAIATSVEMETQPQTAPSQAKSEEVVVTQRIEKPIKASVPKSTKKKAKKHSKEMGRPAMEEPRYRFSATLTDINKKYLKFLANKHDCKISDIINNTFSDMLEKDKRVDRQFLESNY